MKRYLFLLSVCAMAAVTSLSAQTIDTTVCDILSNPPSFDGKIVRVKGTVVSGFDEFAIKDSNCKQPVNVIWLAYPEGTKAKAGSTALVQLQLAKNSSGTAVMPSRSAVRLDKNKDFKQFDSLLSTPYKGAAMCLGCNRYSVAATLTGRLDGTSRTGVAASGFGNMNRYSARLVLQSVADVVGQEIDYTKSAAITKDDSAQSSSGGDPVAAAHQAARAFAAGSPAAEQVEQAAAAYGNPGEDNGVIVGFGVINEVAKGEGGKGDSNSPDGVLFICTFDMDRLKGDALARAITHVGTHIADIRGNQRTQSLFQAEYRAWQTTVLSAVGTRQKTLTLPGAYVVWNAGERSMGGIRSLEDDG
jgi:hypothetical protein